MMTRGALREQDYISGKRYEAQKIINKRRDEKGVFISNAPSTDNQEMDEFPAWAKRTPTAYKQANDEGVGHSTIESNEKFAQGVDAVREVSPELAEKILKPGKDAPSLTKQTVSALSKLKKKSSPEKFGRDLIIGCYK